MRSYYGTDPNPLEHHITEMLESGRSAMDVARTFSLDHDAREDAVLLPGWTVSDAGGEPLHYMAESDPERAARDYLDPEHWDEPVTSTELACATAWRVGFRWDADSVEEACIDERSIAIEFDPDEPDCTDADEHEWSDHSVHGHGGGVILTDRCSRCGVERTIDTWATDPTTGMHFSAMTYTTEAD